MFQHIKDDIKKAAVWYFTTNAQNYQWMIDLYDLDDKKK